MKGDIELHDIGLFINFEKVFLILSFTLSIM